MVFSVQLVSQEAAYPHAISKWTGNWLHVYKQEMPDKTDTERRMTIGRSYSRQAVNSLCETIICICLHFSFTLGLIPW